jgi:nucleoside-diphosphate-sugar epimerase
MKRLENKTAIVTGAANGIGRAISELFAEEGAFVVVTDVEIENGEGVVANIRAGGGQAQFKKADVTQGADVQAAGLSSPLRQRPDAGGKRASAARCFDWRVARLRHFPLDKWFSDHDRQWFHLGNQLEHRGRCQAEWAAPP